MRAARQAAPPLFVLTGAKFTPGMCELCKCHYEVFDTSQFCGDQQVRQTKDIKTAMWLKYTWNDSNVIDGQQLLILNLILLINRVKVCVFLKSQYIFIELSLWSTHLKCDQCSQPDNKGTQEYHLPLNPVLYSRPGGGTHAQDTPSSGAHCERRDRTLSLFTHHFLSSVLLSLGIKSPIH